MVQIEGRLEDCRRHASIWTIFDLFNWARASIVTKFKSKDATNKNK